MVESKFVCINYIVFYALIYYIYLCLFFDYVNLFLKRLLCSQLPPEISEKLLLVANDGVEVEKY